MRKAPGNNTATVPDSANALDNYDTEQAVMPSRDDLDALDFTHHKVLANRMAIAEASEIIPVRLTDRPDFPAGPRFRDSTVNNSDNSMHQAV